ncbi:MAG: aminoacetone oxidase family FAD-binding enzyme [Rhodobacteraceae bacterium]|nr:aminoacetone oxidase family FAD-binding enzyme [Paracoccaceae bacterium]
METVDVVVLGAGAAGMMCAVEAGRRGRRVIVLDQARAPGEKIRISGGGRCNFTNLNRGADRFLSQNPRFALSALGRFTPRDILDRIEGAGIAWHEKTLGQLFCDGSARQVVDLFVRDMGHAGVDLRLGATVEALRHDGRFLVATDRGMVAADSLVVATGGKSIPKMGASDLGYRIARQFGLAVTETRPALVPLTFGAEFSADLAGVAVPAARVGCGRVSFDEAVLITHRGLSGPAILQISSYWREGQGITLNLCPGTDIAQALRQARADSPKAAPRTALARHLPERLARRMEALAGLEGPLGAQSNAALDRLAGLVQRWELLPTGSEGYRTAEVTLGGVDTAALDARTLSAKAVPGLHFIGEVVDVTGWLGGYNFQWAWASGWAAGQVV